MTFNGNNVIIILLLESNNLEVGTMEKKSNLGLIAMIVGIVAIIISIFGGTLSSGNVVVAFILVFVALAAGIVGIVLGVKARKDPNTSKGMATAGLVTGIIATAWSGLSVICVICAVACASSIASSGIDNAALNSALSELSSALQ